MSAILAHGSLPSPWRQALVALLGAVIALVLLYRETFVTMMGIWWRSDTFAHAFLVPPIALWLAWRRREILSRLMPAPQPWLLLPLLAAGLAWVLGDIAGVNAITQLAVTAMLVLSVPAVLGIPVARALAFPLAFLFFMVPIGEFMMPALMEWTADFTVAALQFTGVPVFREGLKFSIPSGSWSVVEACSGVRYLIASFMVGTLFAYLNYRSNTRRLIFCGVSLIVPVVANWLRAYMIVMIGHLSSNQLATGVDHLVYGWVFFGVVILLMFFIGSRWSEPEAEQSPRRGASGMTPAMSRSAGPWLWTGVLVLVAALPLALTWRDEAASAPVLLTLPDLPGFTAAGASATEPLFKPTFKGARADAWRSYGDGERAVTVHVAYYRGQGYGRKLISSDNALVWPRDQQWNHLAAPDRDILLGTSRVRITSAQIIGGQGPSEDQRTRLEVRQIYWVDGRLTHSDHWAAALGVIGRLGGRGDDAAALTIYSPGAGRRGTAERLDQFIEQNLPLILNHLAAIRSSR